MAVALRLEKKNVLKTNILNFYILSFFIFPISWKIFLALHRSYLCYKKDWTTILPGTKIPTEGIVANTKLAISRLPVQEASELRMECAHILTISQPSKNSTHKHIPKADKVNATGLMNWTDYSNKFNSICYRKLSRNAFSVIMKNLIKTLYETFLDKIVINFLTSSVHLRIYGPPKIHKSSVIPQDLGRTCHI